MVQTAQKEYARSSFFKAMFLTNEMEQRQLQTAQFHQDTPGTLNAVAMDPVSNKTEYLRCNAIHNEKNVDVYTPIFSPLLNNEYFLPDNVSFSLQLFPTTSNKCVIQRAIQGTPSTHVKVTILKAQLHLLRCKIPNIPKSLSFNTEFVKTLTYMHAKSLSRFSQLLSTGEQLPEKIAFVCLSEKQWGGSYTNHGFNFQHFKINNIAVRVNGKVLPSPAGMTMNFDERSFLLPYQALFSSLKAKNPLFQLNDFDAGNSVFSFSISNKQDTTKKNTTGSCEVQIDFAEPPTTNIVIIAFCIYKMKITIDNHGQFHSAHSVLP